MFRAFRRFIKRLCKRPIYTHTKKPKGTLVFNFDSRTNKNLKSLHPKAQSEFVKLMEIAVKVADTYGVNVKVISGNRTYEEQQKIYDQGRKTPGPIRTKAKAGFSRHNFGLAADFGVFRNGEYIDAIDSNFTKKIYKGIYNNAEADNLKIEWGGNWKWQDPPHFEYKTGLSLAQLRSAKKNNIPYI